MKRIVIALLSTISGLVLLFSYPTSTNKPITDASWEEYLTIAGESIKDEGPFHGLLLWWPQAAPTAAQRNMLVEKYADTVRLDQQRRAAVVAESLIIRGAMTAIAKLRPTVDAFFDKVKVNDDDKAVRENRLKLLIEIREATRAVADFSKIEG